MEGFAGIFTDIGPALRRLMQVSEKTYRRERMADSLYVPRYEGEEREHLGHYSKKKLHKIMRDSLKTANDN
jgi:hypothetical protein